MSELGAYQLTQACQTQTTSWAAKLIKGPQKCLKVLYVGHILQNQMIEKD